MYQFGFILSAFFLVWVVFIFLTRNKDKQKALNKLRSQWGKEIDRKRSIDFIALYQEEVSDDSAFQLLSPKIWKDLNLDSVFAKIDRTISRIGQQYLYHKLYQVSSNLPQLQQFDRLIEHFQKEEEERTATQSELQVLSNFSAYQTHRLIFDELPEKPKWFFIMPYLSFTSMVLVILSFFNPAMILVLLAVLIANVGIHFWNKNHTYAYRQSLSNILPLIFASQKIVEHHSIPKRKEDIQNTLDKIQSLVPKISFFNAERGLEGTGKEVLWGIVEVLKYIFLIEPIIFFRTTKEVDKYRLELHELFRFVGEIDAAISIASVRSGNPYFCKPSFSDQIKMNIEEAYHPVIDNCITNSLHLDHKGVLLTGSNMSGKTSFIRMIAVNALLGQTIYTCFAKSYTAPFYKIMSSIQIEDSLLEGRSYYFEEVLSIKQLLEAATETAPCLFIIDEVFKGTNTVERVAAAKAVLHHLAKPAFQGNAARAKHLVLVSTHDIELTDLLQDQFDLYHFREMVKDNELLFDYKLKKGQLTTRNAIKILDLNGYPEEVINEAKRIAELVEIERKR